MVEMEAPPSVDPNIFQMMNSILLQQMQVDDPTLGLYYFEDDMKLALFLKARGVDPTTYSKKKVMYVFLKTNIILNPKAVYWDQ